MLFRNLVRLAADGVDLRWLQHGSMRHGSGPPRNVPGFRDGTKTWT